MTDARLCSPADKILLAALLCLIALPTLAAPKKTVPPVITLSSPKLAPKERADLAALLPANPAEATLFAYLDKKNGKAISLPDHPGDTRALAGWFFGRQTNSHNPATLYPLLTQNLRVAAALLGEPPIDRKCLGLVIARYCGLTARINLKDYRLDADICEAFLVPHLDIAYPENGHTVSRRQILEDTYNAYAGTADTPHQITALLFLLRYADSDNTKNWARTMLAQSYEQAGNYNQAIAFLQTTDPVDQAWLTRLQQEQKKSTAVPKPVASKGLHP